MKIKLWDITLRGVPSAISNSRLGAFEGNTVRPTENDEFFTTDTEAFLIFNLLDEDFHPTSATITLHNRTDGSVVNEDVDVIDGVIEYEMRHEVIEHAGVWQAQLVYEQDKDGVPEKYTSKVVSFGVSGHLLDTKEPALVVIENWNNFVLSAESLIEDWEAQLQEHLEELLRGESEIHRAEAEAKESAEKAQQAMSDYLSMLGKDVATLGADGKLSANQIPALAINDTFVVHSKEEIVALVAERGDVAVLVHDENVSDAYILTVDEPNVLDNWIKLGVSYVAKAGHAESASIAVNSQKINGHRVVTLSEEEYNLGAKDPETVYLVGDL